MSTIKPASFYTYLLFCLGIILPLLWGTDPLQFYSLHMVTLGTVLLVNSKTSLPEHNWLIQAHTIIALIQKFWKLSQEKAAVFLGDRSIEFNIQKLSGVLLRHSNWRSRESQSPERGA